MSGRRGELSCPSFLGIEPFDCAMGMSLALSVLIDKQLLPVGGGWSRDDQRRPRPLRRISSSADKFSPNTLSCRNTQ